MVISLILPFNAFRQGKNNALIQEEVDRIMNVSPALVERFGLLTIIVLGEVVVSTVNGVAGHHHLDLTVGITTALGMLIAIAFWWLYFDFVSHRKPLATMPLLIILVLAMVTPVFYGIKMWIQVFGAEEIPIH